MDMESVRQYLCKSQCLAKIGFQFLTPVVEIFVKKDFLQVFWNSSNLVNSKKFDSVFHFFK